MLFLLWFGCSSDPEPSIDPPTGDRSEQDDTTEDRDSRDDEQSNESNADYCYEAGWYDCYDYYDPDPAYWGCVGTDADWYGVGYCDCEAYYQDWYWC